MIDKIISYFLFFSFLFLLLFILKDYLLKEDIANKEKYYEIKVEDFVAKNFMVYDCYKILKGNSYDIVKFEDNFNPKINGYILVTEELLCYFNHSGYFETKISYSLK